MLKLSLCLSAHLICVVVSPFTVVADEPNFVIRSEATITKHPNANFFQAEFDLGTLPSGESGNVVLVVYNPLERPFRFEKITKTCNCVGIKTASGEKIIDADSKREFYLTLKTPETAKNGIVYSDVTLIGNDDAESGNDVSRMNLKIKYHLSGLLSVAQNLYSCEIPLGSDFGKIAVPVLVTQPIQIKNVKIQLSQSLRDLIFEIKKSENSDEIYVVAEIPAVMVEQGPLSGEVRIIDEINDRKDGFFVTVSRASDVKISPRVLRFADKSETESSLVAKAILTLPAKPSESPNKEVNDQNKAKSLEYKTPIINVTVGGKKADVAIKRLSSRIFRLSVSVNENDGFDFEKEVKWELDIETLGKRSLWSKFLVND